MLTSIEDNKPQLVSPRGRRLSQIAQQTSPVVFPEKRSKKTKSKSKKTEPKPNEKPEEIRINIEENSGLLGGALITGKLTWDKRKSSNTSTTSTEITPNLPIFSSKLTNKALTWGSNTLHLSDVVSVTYNINVRYFTVHAYPLQSLSPFNCFKKPKKARRDFRFIASTVDDAVQWVGAFADHHCYINCLPHPPPELIFRCKTAPKMLVILNPRSGRGRSVKVFERFAEPILKLAGFNLEVVKTTSAGHARNLAASVDIATCPDGIICVGGDGIINEVLNGLLSRENQKEGISIPIGIIPAGSDNSLVWTVLGVRDPASAAISIVKGGLTATDVFAVEWIETGARHFGMTVSYYGFISDVLEQCEKYQKRFGPLRYFVAGFLKFLCLPNYNYEVEFQIENVEGKTDKEVIDVAEIYTDYMRKSPDAALPRASSLSSVDSATTAGSEPSEYVRAIDPKVKRLSSGKTSLNSEPEVIHPQVQFSTTPNWPRTRSKSRNDKGWSGQTVAQNQGINDDISSTLSDPGPIWDAEPKWEPEESSIELPGPTGLDGNKREVFPRFDEKWEFRKGTFLGILICNHACRTVQSSQVVAPRARPDDYSMDLILVHGSGRFRLLRFFLLLQMGRHTTLPFVEYVKVKGVKVKALKNTHNGCGIDGELFSLDGQVRSFLLAEQCRLIGRPPP